MIHRFKNLQISDNDIIGNKFNGHDLHFYLRSNGIDSTQLVWNKQSNDPNTYLIAGEKDNRQLIHSFIADIQSQYRLNGVINPHFYDILYNQKFLEADVVHFHLIHNGLVDLHLLPLMSRLKPIVWTLHDPWSIGGHCVHHYDCDKWKRHCQDCPYLNAHFSLKEDNSALNFALKKQAIQDSNLNLIVASKWMYEKTKSSPIFNGKNIHLIPFGINQKIFKPLDKNSIRKKLHIPIDALVILFRCDYSEFKGMDYIDYVLKKLNSEKEIFVITTAQKLNASCKFKTLEYGWVTDDHQLADLYNAADLFLAPSKVDAFGMMAIEAMSCGTLPIVLDGTALPETVNAPYCGISVERNKEAYFLSVQYYLDHKKVRIIQADKCVEYARKNYNIDRYLGQIIEVYNQAKSSHILNSDHKIILSQLSRYMATKPTLGFRTPKYLNSTDSIQNPLERKVVMKFFILTKFFPKPLRQKVKQLLKISF